MALENCFQLSTVCSSRAAALQCYHPFSSKEKLNLPTCNGLKKPIQTSSLSSSSYPHSLRTKSRQLSVVCQAREAVDAGQLLTLSITDLLQDPQGGILANIFTFKQNTVAELTKAFPFSSSHLILATEGCVFKQLQRRTINRRLIFFLSIFQVSSKKEMMSHGCQAQALGPDSWPNFI